MASASIRPITDSDDTLIRFMVAKIYMGQLAAANRRAYAHPLVLAVWLGLSCVFVEYMHWWPKPRHGFIGYLTPFPAFASVLVPIMFLIDWVNRPYFEKLTQDALRAPDMKNITSYYSRSPASGFWIVDYGERFVGLIAIDASTNPLASQTSQTAVIRHFFVQDPYPASGIQDDLLSHAVHQCFNANSGIVQRIIADDSPLVPYVRTSLKEAGFVLERHTQTVGAFRWKLGMRSLDRDVWEKKNA
ncbi:hypothetical protein C8F04DRAFT_1089685 [Mycena alexandri]|uniref:N-acetyltransferase domain-containing protein n=1 Tax=Mycena alexandri TaxID=1745969 RepID=A0AAD6T2K6_9AGAR|nr:hypothetical protein C8F04DRAFT_1089685 [Mycena alexandri]